MVTPPVAHNSTHSHFVRQYGIPNCATIDYSGILPILAAVRLDLILIPVEKTYQFVPVEQDGNWLLDDVVDELRFSLP